ncbi:hypothetical protein Daura_27445 [Dactylosporangium aurantiacum]|uniref:Uncharacterized protein n=1 Tax=Dactylosporangium aurantiacum TaxID=35754 RepID=A0A9Q9MI16_9ACTN|nr:hypothetical protein [Dactylosporangium aurantiacum]MDG6106397.1 hypothetical protein [Dactylosporangium aurantiacum]UWZ50562.1 hypothetical protein Daura_27445 [Dactylosporangium aurantiacum]
MVGSLDPARDYDQPLRGDLAVARSACEQIGGELLRHGFDLLVFSSAPQHAEGLFVAGYVAAASPGTPGRIVARPARHQEFVPGSPHHASVELLVLRDPSAEWEVAYYRSVLSADAVVLVGGRRSTRIAGIVAISQGVPVLPLAAFGGGAEQVWDYLDRDRHGVAENDVAMLGAPWTDGSAARLAGYLRREIDRRERERARELRAATHRARAARLGLAVAAAALVGALATIALAGGPGPAGAKAVGLLLAGPMLAAVAGAVIRDSLAAEQRWGRAAVLGLGAGVVAVLLYVASQLLTVPDLLDHLDARRLLFFVVPVGFAAGFTFDLVYERIRAGQDPMSGITPPAVAPDRPVP